MHYFGENVIQSNRFQRQHLFILALRTSEAAAGVRQADSFSVEHESILGSETGSESILWPYFSTNPDPNRFFQLILNRF